MRTFRRAASLLLLLPVIALTACQEAPHEPEVTASHTPGLDPGNPAPPFAGGPPVIDSEDVPLALEPASISALEAAAANGDWPAFWNELAWDVSDDFTGDARIWAVIVRDREAKLSFLSDPIDPAATSGPGDAIDAPDEDDWVPPDEWVPSKQWVPGNMWVPGDDWVPGNMWLPDDAAAETTGEPLPAAAAFFQSDAWVPPDDWIPTPDHWAVNGIIDGIWDETEAAIVRERVNTKMLIMPLATERQSGQQAMAGILVNIVEDNPETP